MKHYHPQKNDHGLTVEITKPSQATKLPSWAAPDALATITPGAVMPDTIGGVSTTVWADAPTCVADWEKLVAGCDFDEPEFQSIAGKKPAAGVVTIEADGRVWVISPTNQFGGYQNTFPKGRIEAGMSLRASAIKEAYEESGLKVELVGFLADIKRSTTHTRYYLARRVGGNPSAMGWESQAVHLAPRSQLAQLLTNPNDEPLLEALAGIKSLPTRNELLKPYAQRYGIASGVRLLSTLNGFMQRHGEWPIRIAMDGGMYKALQQYVFTPLAWSMMTERLSISPDAEGTVVAYGDDGRTFDYEDVIDRHPPQGNRADVWLWGIHLQD